MPPGIRTSARSASTRSRAIGSRSHRSPATPASPISAASHGVVRGNRRCIARRSRRRHRLHRAALAQERHRRRRCRSGLVRSESRFGGGARLSPLSSSPAIATTSASAQTCCSLLLAAQEGEWEEVDGAIRAFQQMTAAIKFCPRPVVVAPFGHDPWRWRGDVPARRAPAAPRGNLHRSGRSGRGPDPGRRRHQGDAAALRSTPLRRWLRPIRAIRLRALHNRPRWHGAQARARNDRHGEGIDVRRRRPLRSDSSAPPIASRSIANGCCSMPKNRRRRSPQPATRLLRRACRFRRPAPPRWPRSKWASS